LPNSQSITNLPFNSSFHSINQQFERFQPEEQIWIVSTLTALEKVHSPKILCWFACFMLLMKNLLHLTAGSFSDAPLLLKSPG
jgi:hypothetical protein